MTLHYELVPEDQITHDGCTLTRIRATVDLPEHGVFIGRFGGYVGSTNNLFGNAWVFENARVSGNARVFGSARVFDNAWVHGDAEVAGRAWVHGNAEVFGNAFLGGNARASGHAHVSGDTHVAGNAWVFANARVSGDAVVSGNAAVAGNADWLLVGPAKSSGRVTTAYRTATGVQVNCGCFSGTPAEFLSAIEETHKYSPQYLAQYRAFHALILANFS